MQIERNADVAGAAAAAARRGAEPARVLVDGESVSFRHEDGMLVIDNLPERDRFTLEIRNTCAPEKNTQLSGLYTSSGGFFTQCEAEGFRRITYFLDRPDVMARYTVTLRADKAAYPVLLSNGNLVEQGDARRRPPLREVARPVPEAELPVRAGRRPTWWRASSASARARGKDHLLQVYVRRGDLDKTEHAMNSLIALDGLGRGALRPASSTSTAS